MPIQSLNPATEEVLKIFEPLTQEQIEEKIQKGETAFENWKLTTFALRAELMKKLAENLRAKAEEYGKIISLEMGKPLTASKAEVEKCAWNAEYLAENAERFLSPQPVETEGKESYIRFDPLGIIFEIMPWNFPFWQALRFGLPQLMAGNVCLLKHASNVPQSAIAIEEAIVEAGFPEGVFQTLLIGSDQTESIISDKRIKGVSLTGSDKAGSQVAELAGKHLKKSVMELGGSDPFIVLEDADITKAVNACTAARLNNNGQVCNSPKRAIVHKAVADEFISKLKTSFEMKKIGDPLDPSTELGPLSSKQILDDLSKQVQDTIDKGAKLITGGEKIEGKGYFYKPTILVLNPEGKPAKELIGLNMPAFDRELFGPVSAIIIVENTQETIEIANQSEYGLSASIWSSNIEEAKKLLPLVNAGAVYINKTVTSDPRLPIGGIGISGYGRELSEYGLKEFVNIKSVWIEE